MLENYQNICPTCGSIFIRTKEPEPKPVKEQKLKFECTDCKFDWAVRKPVWLQRRMKEIELAKERAKE